MHDPFPFESPKFLQALVSPLTSYLNLPTLNIHIHEVLLAFTFYHLTCTVFSPILSNLLFPKIYPNLNKKTKLNWDVHVVSLVQSTLINTLALWVMWVDEERWNMGWRERVWGYTGASGMIQGFATGYFLWDLVVSAQNVSIFGWGLLAHAVSALWVFSLGFRPFVNFYGPTFILYELSSPFLNFHWFFDKLNMTGSRAQLYNGLILLATFFSCRLVWGTYQSVRVYQDVWAALQNPGTHHAPTYNHPANRNLTASGAGPYYGPQGDGMMRFNAKEQAVPVWLAVTYLGSNLVLNTLNFYWFGKMIETVRKRFQPPAETLAEKGKDGVKMNSVVEVVEEKGGRKVIVEKTEVRRRRAG